MKTRLSGLFMTFVALTCAANAQSNGDARLEGFRRNNSMENARASLVVLSNPAASANQRSDADSAIQNLARVAIANAWSFVRYVSLTGQSAAFSRFLTTLSTARNDKQNGSGPSAGGTTSLLTKPSATSVISAAVEDGALVQTAKSGPTTTFQGNLVGIGRLLLNEDPFPFCPITQASCDKGAIRALDPLTISLSLDANGQTTNNVPVSGNATPATAPAPSSVNLTSSSQRISSFGLKYAFLNPHALDSQASRTAFVSAVSNSADDALISTAKIFGGKDGNPSPGYQSWVAGTIAEIRSWSPTISQGEFEDRFSARLDELVTTLRMSNSNFDSDVSSAVSTRDAYLNTRQNALQTLAKGVNFSFEYTYDKPLNQPRTSVFRLIGAWSPSSRTIFTANGAVTLYNQLPAGATANRLRDAQAALELDMPLNQLGKVGAPTLSAAGYFQYMVSPGLITIPAGTVAPNTNITLPGSAVTLLGQRGNIGIAQIKISMPFGNSGVTVPFAVTWSNRTELLPKNGSGLGAHIGISYDLDSLFAQKSSN